MFRDFAQRMAKKYSILGSVQNMKDGSVRVLAQGEKEQLEKYLKLLKKGPILARVDDIETVWKKPTEVFESFRIVY